MKKQIPKISLIIIYLYSAFLFSVDREEDCFSSIKNHEQRAVYTPEVFHYIISQFDTHSIDTARLHAVDCVQKSNLSQAVKEELCDVLNDLVTQEAAVGDTFSMNEKNIPGDLVVGGVEILVGTLMHLIPGGGWLGKALIADGIRRAGNSIVEADAKNRSALTSYSSSE